MKQKQLLLAGILIFSTPAFAQQMLGTQSILLEASGVGTGSDFNFEDERISLSKNGVTLNEILKEINKCKKIHFMLEKEIEKYPWRTNVNYKNELISKILDNLKKEFPIIYIIDGSIIHVKFHPKIIKSVTLQVFDARNNPVSGAIINSLRPRDVEYVTNRDGKTAISYLLPGDSISVNTDRYMTVKVAVNGTSLIIRLTNRVKTMRSVTVHNNGVEKIPDRIATGSFKTVDVRKISDVNASANFIDRLQVSLPIKKNDNPVNGSQPGAIRGSNTFYGNRNAFLVVNDFPFTVPSDLLNPNDIDSTTILRDAGAGAIWGTSSANGVYSLAYKKGFSNKRIINFISSVTIGEKPDLFYQQGMNAATRVTFDSLTCNSPLDNTPVGDLLKKVDNNVITMDSANKVLAEWRKNDLLKDIRNKLYDNPVSQQYAINIQTGGPHFLFYASGGLDEKKLAQQGNTWSRKTALLNSSYEKNNFTVEGAIAITGITSKNNAVPLPSSPRYVTLADKNGNPASIPYLYSSDFVQSSLQNGFLDWHYRPLEEAALADNTTSQRYYSFSGKTSYAFPKGFKASVAYQHSLYIKNDELLHKQESFFTRDLINSYRQDSAGIISWPVPRGDIFDGADMMVMTYYLRTQLDYSLTKNDFRISALAGLDKRSFDLKGKEYRIYGSNLSASSYRMNYDMEYALNTGNKARIPSVDRHYDSADHFWGYYGSAFVTYKDRYTFSTNVRKDWSNRFSPGINNKGVGLWSIGIGWNIDNEPFFTRNATSRLKLRASYGVNGNIDYSIIPTNSIQSDNNGKVYYAIPSTGQISWEKISMFNIGVDIKNKFITGSIDFYLKRGYDLLQFTPRNPVTGASIIKDNSGSLKGKGLDIDLQTKNIPVYNKLAYTTGIVLAYSANKTTSSARISKKAFEMIDPYSFSPVAGYPTDALFAYKFAGLDENGAPMGYLDGKKSTDYSNIMSTTDTSSLQYVGSAVPITGINWVNSFHYKKWSVSVMLAGKFGYWVHKPALNYFKIIAGQGGDAPGFDDRWKNSGDEKTKTIPAMPYAMDVNAMSFYEGSTANVVKGDHVRIQYLQLAYRYERSKGSNFLFDRLECLLTASNLGIIYRANKDRIDPDVPLNGYPAGRSVTLTLKLSY